MKRNVWKGLLFLASVALVLSAGGCKDKDEPGKMTQDGKAASVTFRLTLPKAKPIRTELCMMNRNGR